MPELPEVEVTRLGLLNHLINRQIVWIGWSNKRLRLPIPHKLLRQQLIDKTITAIDRRAKYLLIRFQDGAVLVFHLGMTGKLGMFPATEDTAAHDHLFVRLDNGMELRFNDTRRFGSITVWPAEKAQELEKQFTRTKGIEPFSSEFTASRLFQLGEKRSIAIKTFIMDARIIAGIGNIYASETLFAAGIHPQANTSEISTEQWEQFIVCCRDILNRAIQAGGSTISDFLGSSGKPGYFQLQLAVYGKKNTPCPQCSQPISKITITGRTTYFCSHCQPR